MQRIKEKRDDGHLPPWVGFQEFGCSLSTIPYCHVFYILCIYIYIHHISILTVHLPFDTLKQYCSSLSIRTPAVDTSVTSTRGARPSAARAMDALESTSEAMTPCQPKCWENPVHQAIPLPCPVEQDDPVSSSPGEPGEKSPLFKPKVLVCSRWKQPLAESNTPWWLFGRHQVRVPDLYRPKGECPIQPAEADVFCCPTQQRPTWVCSSCSPCHGQLALCHCKKNEAPLHHTVQVPIAKKVPAIFSKLFTAPDAFS